MIVKGILIVTLGVLVGLLFDKFSARHAFRIDGMLLELAAIYLRTTLLFIGGCMIVLGMVVR